MALVFAPDVQYLRAKRYSLQATDGNRKVTFIIAEGRLMDIPNVPRSEVLDLSLWLKPGGQPRKVLEMWCREAYIDGSNITDEIMIG